MLWVLNLRKCDLLCCPDNVPQMFSGGLLPVGLLATKESPPPDAPQRPNGSEKQLVLP